MQMICNRNRATRTAVHGIDCTYTLADVKQTKERAHAHLVFTIRYNASELKDLHPQTKRDARFGSCAPRRCLLANCMIHANARGMRDARGKTTQTNYAQMFITLVETRTRVCCCKDIRFVVSLALLATESRPSSHPSQIHTRMRVLTGAVCRLC